MSSSSHFSLKRKSSHFPTETAFPQDIKQFREEVHSPTKMTQIQTQTLAVNLPKMSVELISQFQNQSWPPREFDCGTYWFEAYCRTLSLQWECGGCLCVEANWAFNLLHTFFQRHVVEVGFGVDVGPPRLVSSMVIAVSRLGYVHSANSSP